MRSPGLRPRRWAARALLVGPLVLALGSLACGGHLHRRGDALLSEAATEELEALEFDRGFAARELAEGELLGEELDAALEQVAADRDAALLVVIDDLGGTGRKTWGRKLDQRLNDLTGQGMDADMSGLGERLGRAGSELAGFEASIRGLERARDSYLARAVALGLSPHEVPMPRCPGADDPARSPGLDESWQDFAQACELIGAQLVEISQNNGGALGTRAQALVAIDQALSSRAERARALMVDYEDARAECAAEVRAQQEQKKKQKQEQEQKKKQKDPSHDALAVAAAGCMIPKLDASLMGLDSLGYDAGEREPLLPYELGSLGTGAGDPARLRLVDEQLGAVERILAFNAAGHMTSDGAQGEDSLSERIEVGLALAVTHTVARVSLNPSNGSFGVRRSELALIRELLVVDHVGSSEIHDLGRRRLDLLYLGLESMLRERVDLLAAESFLLEPSCASLGVTEGLLVPVDDPLRYCGSYLRGSLIQYANSWSLGLARQREAQVRGDAAYGREMRVRSGMTLAERGLWMAAAVAELQRYNATGLDPATLATLLTNVAGFAVVAAGVFR